MNHNAFQPADILLYNGADRTSFAVIACDQYTSEPEYWDRIAARTQDKPSAFHLIFPEAYLKTADFDATITSINTAMADYLERGLFDEHPNSFLYVERTQRNGRIRHGLIGKIDLEQYDYTPGSTSAVRATEGTVLDRIPPRVKIRERAPLELPHVMLLIDDREKSVIEPLALVKDTLIPAYSFPLMEDSGHLDGWLLPQTEAERVSAALDALCTSESFRQRYGDAAGAAFPYAVGDGNHSLATARRCYLDLKERIGAEAALHHPARYALVELVNLHDDSLQFEAVHRILFDVRPEEVMAGLHRRFLLTEGQSPDGQPIGIVIAGQVQWWTITNPSRSLAVGSLQEFLDDYLTAHSGEIDYIHGEDVVRALSAQEHSIGFLLPCMDKNDLFRTVILDGALPRKTFSMGDAWDKRFYFEARRIQP